MNEKELFNDAHLNEAGVTLYVDALFLSAIEKVPETILNHVEECQKCKNEILELYEICKSDPNHNFNDSSSLITPEKSRLDHSIPIFLRIAAGILLIISITFILRYGFSKIPSVNTIISNSTNDSQQTKSFNDSNDLPDKPFGNKKNIDIKNKSKEQNYIAANFKAYPVFENLIKTKYRSGLSIQILTPKEGTKLSQDAPLLFSWEGEINEIFNILILNNKAEQVDLIKDIKGNKIIYPEKLKTGLYYWKIETEDELIFLGKFVIK
jgi:hypothetical protein